MLKFLDKKDFINLLILNFFVIAGFVITYAHFGNLIVDCGREAFLPTVAFDKENVMYRDIFNLYPPLSYQLNGILYKIFGENLRVLYFAGLFNTLIIISALYYISRYFLDNYLSFLVVFFTIFYCVFGSISSSIEFIYPYSFAYVYAFSGFLLSFALFLKYLREYDFKFLPISLFFLGFSLANKFEFSLTIFVYILALFVLKPKLNPKEISFSLLSFFILPVLSYGYLFYQGLNFDDVKNYIDFGKRFFATEGYKDFSGINLNYFSLILDSFKDFLIEYIGFLILFLYLIIFKKHNKLILFCLSVLGICLFKISYLEHDMNAMCGLAIPAFLIFMFCLIKSFKHFSKIEFSYFLLVVSVILSAVKINFLTPKFNYGYYLIPLFVLIYIIFIKNFSKIGSKINLKQFLSVVLISVSLITAYIQSFELYLKTKNFKIETAKGTIYTKPKIGKPFNDALNYIKNNTPQDATVLVLQEGIMLNFLSDRKTNLMLYHLINIHIEALGEDYIIKNLSKNPPDYFVIIESEHITPKIVEFINNNYKREAVFDTILIGKRKGL